MTARDIWARLASEVVPSSTPAATVDEPLVVAGFRCARCGGYCPTCAAAPAGWGAVARPEQLDEDALREALIELEPPMDGASPGSRRVRLIARPGGDR